MTWEEDTIVDRIRGIFRSRSSRADVEAQRRRSNRIRSFLTVFGATHYADRVEGRRTSLARRGHVAL